MEWRHLSRRTLDVRAGDKCSLDNETLLAAAGREPQSPVAPLYRLWAADNLLRDRRYADAIKAHDRVIDAAQAAEPLYPGLDPVRRALDDKAGTAALAGDRALAIAAYRELAAHAPEERAAFFHAGLLAEADGDAGLAGQLYRKVAAKAASSLTDDPAELARRALLRLKSPDTVFDADPRQLADRLSAALTRRDAATLQGLCSQTHFAAGVVGGHTMFEQPDLLDSLFRELAESAVTARRSLLGSGGKLYLQTSGWTGRWFRGDVLFLLDRTPRGWQWTGVAVTQANELWAERWRPATIEKNQPLPFELAAPWPIDRCFQAGGFNEYLIQQAALALIPWPVSIGVLAYWAAGDCGFGPRGFYFNQFTHTGNSAFAIDFTRYRENVPYDNESHGTPVLAAREGIVFDRYSLVSTGDSSRANFVEIDHIDPANPSNPKAFRSRYLHLDGPAMVDVSPGMHVRTGTRLGEMDDTGNSVLHHLHFSIHDGATGKSIRPTPMAGVTLQDGDSGKCVCSRTIEEEPVIEVTEFAGQNWLITPAATAVNEAPPRRPQDQKWLLVLSGVAMVTVKGASTSAWKRQTVSIRPDMDPPLRFALTRHGIAFPDGASLRFQVEQWAPFASLGSIFNQNQSVNSGFAVDVWRPNPFDTGIDAATNASVGNIFEGIQVDVAVRDSDAFIFRLGYNITLLGKIVPTQVIIT